MHHEGKRQKCGRGGISAIAVECCHTGDALRVADGVSLPEFGISLFGRFLEGRFAIGFFAGLNRECIGVLI